MANAMELLTRKFRLVQLTKEELKVQTKVDDYEMWGAPALTQEQYQRKEALQRATPFSQRGSIFWALVERRTPLADGATDDASDASLVAGVDAICAHCESHRFDCVFRKRSGELMRGFSHHIGSVFTLPAFRKQGLASFFLNEVAKAMAQLPDAVASVLYSDIGPTFYDRLGWRLYPSTLAELPTGALRNAAAIDGADQRAPATGASLYLDDALDAFLAQDARRIETELVSAEYADREVFAPLATRDSIEWQFCIGVHYARIRGFTELPTRCGVRIDDDAFVVWCHNLKESTLYIVRARFPMSGRHDAVRALLTAALAEARAYKLAHVAIWDPPAAVFAPEVASGLDVVASERPDSLSSAMVFAQHRDISAASLPVWIANEKFAWV